MAYYRPKNVQEANAAPDGRLIVPSRLRDRLSSDRLRLHDVAGTLYWAHENYGLGPLAQEYGEAVRLFKTVGALLERTTTGRRVRYEREHAA